MESTDAADDKNELQLQFQKLQEKQLQKQLRRKKKQNDKTSTSLVTESQIPDFGIDDDLGLELSPQDSNSQNLNPGISEELVQSLNDQIRELRDETGRLYKLLSEREFENKKLKRKAEEDRLALAGGPGPASDTAATKIVELSKRVRELTSEMEREKTKSKQWAKRVSELETQLQVVNTQTSSPRKGERHIISNSAPPWRSEADEEKEVDLKIVQEKLKQTESKMTEYRNQCQNLKQELKVAHKVLASEVGEGVNVQSLLSAPSGYKGRQQQILNLQKKVTELKSQLNETPRQSRGSEYSLEEELLGSSAVRKNNVEDRNREQLRKLDKERKEAQERAAAEMKALEEDYKDLKNKLEAAKARNKVLSNEMKSSKENMQRLLTKGKHDDELIEALMKQQEHMKSVIEENTRLQKQQEENKGKLVQEMALKAQQENNTIEQLKTIVAEKEAKIRTLEENVQTMKNHEMQTADDSERMSALFEVVSPTESDHKRPTSRDQETRLHSPPSSRLSQRTVSRQSGCGDITDRTLSSRVSSARTPAPPGDSQMNQDLQRQSYEYKTLLQAAEVERDKLAELVNVLQTRINEMIQEMSTAQAEIQSQRRRSVMLEKQLGKVKVAEQAQAVKSGVKRTKSKNNLSQSVSRDVTMTTEDSAVEGNLEEIQTNLEIQTDENEALKAALQRTLRAKEDDLKLYQQVMEETRRVFLQGLRQYKQS